VQAKYLLSYKPIPNLYILVLSTKIGKDQTWNIHKILTKNRTKSSILCKHDRSCNTYSFGEGVADSTRWNQSSSVSIPEEYTQRWDERFCDH
jgi:hypothetical protein